MQKTIPDSEVRLDSRCKVVPVVCTCIQWPVFDKGYLSQINEHLSGKMRIFTVNETQRTRLF